MLLHDMKGRPYLLREREKDLNTASWFPLLVPTPGDDYILWHFYFVISILFLILQMYLHECLLRLEPPLTPLS